MSRDEDAEFGPGGMYLSLILWAIVPNFITSALHRIYYAFRYPVDSRAKPTPNSPKYQRHRRSIMTFVVTSYLAFTVYEAYASLSPTHYNTLGLNPQTFTVKDLKSSFKKLSLLHHPDKHQGDDKEFIKIRGAYETLNDPNRKFVYDRWGNDGTQCQSCKTLRDYFQHAAPSSLAFYMGAGFVLVLLNVARSVEFGQYWRFIVFISLALAEAWLVLYRPDTTFHKLCNALMPQVTSHQQVLVLRSVYVTLFIAISQIGPLYFPIVKQDLEKDLIELAQLSDVVLKDTSGTVKTVLEPFSNDPDMLNRIKIGMSKLAAELKLFENAEYSRSYGQALERRHRAVPIGKNMK